MLEGGALCPRDLCYFTNVSLLYARTINSVIITEIKYCHFNVPDAELPSLIKYSVWQRLDSFSRSIRLEKLKLICFFVTLVIGNLSRVADLKIQIVTAAINSGVGVQ